MKKFTIFFLAALFMVAGTAYLISMTGGDKAEHQAMRDNVLSLKKAMLGSAGLDVTLPDRVVRARSEGRVRIVSNFEQTADEADEDEGADGGSCPACSGADEGGDDNVLSGTIAPGDTDIYCLSCCVGQMIKLDVNSEKLGALTDMTVVVTDGTGNVVVGDDDGRGLSGTSTDACVLFECPADGQYNVAVSNISMAPVSEAASGYELTAEVLCPQPVTSLNCPVSVADETDDETGDGGPLSADEGGDTGGCAFDGGSGRIQGNLGNDACYSVCLNLGDVLRVSVDSAECDNVFDGTQVDPNLTLEDESANVVASDDDTDDLDPGLFYHAETCGQHTLCISDGAGVGGVFDLSWSITPGGETDNINCSSAADEDQDLVCIYSVTIRNNRTGTEETFYRDPDFGIPLRGKGNKFAIDGDEGGFHCSCSQCLRVGDVSGNLELIGIDDPSGRIELKCQKEGR